MNLELNQHALPLTCFEWRQMLASVAIAILLVPASAGAQSAGAVDSNNNASAPHFVTPPMPKELAALLYPPPSRSLEVNKKNPPIPAVQPAPFSMAIHFGYDSAKILHHSLPMLDSIGQMLNLPKVRDEGLVIEGHTDAQGSERYNANLALRRAQAIKRYLADSYDIDPARMLTVSFGETRLANPEDPTHPRNRRAAFRPMSLH